MIAIPVFEICAFKDSNLSADREREKGDPEKLNILLFLHTLSLPNFESAYLESVNSYQKVVNYKNIELDLIYKKNVNLKIFVGKKSRDTSLKLVNFSLNFEVGCLQTLISQNVK